MDYTKIPEQTSLRLSDDERRVIAAVLDQHPHLGGKVSRAVSFALFESQKADEYRKMLQAAVWALKGHIDQGVAIEEAEKVLAK